MTQLSTFFTLEEMLHSQVAARKPIANLPSADEFLTLQATAKRMDEVRRLLCAPVLVSSGYRSAELNRAIGGSKTSSHMRGEAVDFTCPGYGSVRRVFDRIRSSGIKFDQLIFECGEWVHIGFGPKMRGEVLVFDGKTYTKEKP